MIRRFFRALVLLAAIPSIAQAQVLITPEPFISSSGVVSGQLSILLLLLPRPPRRSLPATRPARQRTKPPRRREVSSRCTYPESKRPTIRRPRVGDDEVEIVRRVVEERRVEENDIRSRIAEVGCNRVEHIDTIKDERRVIEIGRLGTPTVRGELRLTKLANGDEELCRVGYRHLLRLHRGRFRLWL